MNSTRDSKALLADPQWVDEQPGRSSLLQSLASAVMRERHPINIDELLKLAASQSSDKSGWRRQGGGQTLRVFTAHPDRFSYVGIWSTGPRGNAEEWEKRNKNFLAHADHVNNSVKRLEIVVGDRDFALNRAKSLAEVFKKRGIEHELRITSGGHTWINWRHYLHDLSQHLFREHP